MNSTKMNLLSLPDEMLANVLKYTDYITATRLRKKSSRVHKITKSYDIGNKLPVDSLSFTGLSRWTDEKVEWKCELYIDCTILRFCNYPLNKYTGIDRVAVNFKIEDLSHPFNIHTICSKIEIKNSIKMKSFEKNDQLLDIFLKNRKSFRKITSLELCSTHVVCSQNVFREFIKSTKQLLSIDCMLAESYIDIILESGALNHRPWKKIFLHPYQAKKHTLSHMNDEFLLKVVKNCEDFTCRLENRFTVGGIIEFIKACMLEPIAYRSIKLSRIQCKKTSIPLVKKQIKSIRADIHCVILHQRYTGREQNWCTIYWANNSSQVTFGLYDDSDID